MNKIRNLTEFCNEFIADSTSKNTKVVNCITETYRYNMRKIEENLPKIYEFIGKNLGLSDGNNNLECLFFDQVLNCFGTISTIEELEYLNKIIGLLVSSDIITLIFSNNNTILDNERYLESVSIEQLLHEVRVNLNEITFFVNRKFVECFPLTLDNINENDIKIILDKWYLLTATKPIMQLQYENFKTALNNDPIEVLQVMASFTSVLDGVDTLVKYFNRGETFCSLIKKYSMDKPFIKKHTIYTLAFLYKIKNVYISTLSEEKKLSKNDYLQ